LQELAPERAAACTGIEALHLTPVLFELGARPHAPRDLYRAYLDQSHVFVGIYWQSYGWVGPGAAISGIEDEYMRSSEKPRLLYVKEPAPQREGRLKEFLDGLRAEATVSYKHFETADELAALLRNDLAVLLAERFAAAAGGNGGPIASGTLPTRLTSFVGRAEELEQIEELLTGGSRLLTLTGPGGIGKTRLAIEAAQRVGPNYDLVAFVPLASVASTKLVLPAISGTLALREIGGDPLEGLVAYLRGRTTLLVLDNFEHVIEAVPEIAALLDRAPGVTAIVTSREVLRVRGEIEFRVPPLSAADEAIPLFAARASTTGDVVELDREDLPVVAEICRRLDCMPLAIELAAPRLRLLSATQLLERLNERLALAGPRDAPARQQTLEGAIAWSYELLEPAQRELFERLGVFPGSFTIDAAEAIGGDGDVVEALGALLDKSLLYRVSAGQGRFAMLSLIREFAYGRLSRSVALETTLERFTDFYVASAVQWEKAMRTTAGDWVVTVDEEADNVRAVVSLLIDHGRGPELATLIRGVWVWLWLRGRLDEGREWVRRALLQRDQLKTDDLAWMLLVGGCVAYFQADFEVAAAELGEAQTLFEGTGDALGAATTLTIASMVNAVTLGRERALADLARALAVFEEESDPWGIAVTLSGTARIRSIFGEFEGAEALFDRTLLAAEELGDPFLVLLALDNHVYLRLSNGEMDAARGLVDRSLELVRATGVRYGVDDLLDAYALLEAEAGDYTRAAELLGTAEALRTAMRTPLWGPLIDRRAKTVEPVQEALGPAALEEALARGRELPLEHWCEPTLVAESV